MFVPIHFLIPRPEDGRVISSINPQLSGGQGGKNFTLKGAACNADIGLPDARNKHGFTGDSRSVSCADCYKTAEFLADYKLQTGEDFVPA